MNVQGAATNPIFFMAVSNAMGQQQQFMGTNFQQLGQQLQSMFQGNGFQMGGMASGFGQMGGAQWGNFNQSGFLTPPAGMGGSPMSLAQTAHSTQGFQNALGSMQGFRPPGRFQMVGQMMNMMMSMVKLLGQMMSTMKQLRPGVQLPGGAMPMPGGKPMAQTPQMAGQQAGQFGGQMMGGFFPGAGGVGGGFFMAGGMFGANAAQAQAPVVPQISAEDKKVLAHMDATNGKKWLASHGHYKRSKDGCYEFTKGPLKGYQAKPLEKGTFAIINPKGQEIGEWEAPNNADKVASPVAFDLNGDGKLGTTGATTAKDRLAGTDMGRTVQFDIDGDGRKDTIEWMNGDGDGLLVDNTDGNAAHDMSGKRLFGDEGGKFANGYDKLKLRDANNDGKLTGDELRGLEMWIDNGDAQVDGGEMKSLQELGINEIAVNHKDVTNDRGETLMQATAKREDGSQILTEDVWFGQENKG